MQSGKAGAQLSPPKKNGPLESGDGAIAATTEKNVKNGDKVYLITYSLTNGGEPTEEVVTNLDIRESYVFIEGRGSFTPYTFGKDVFANERDARVAIGEKLRKKADSLRAQLKRVEAMVAKNAAQVGATAEPGAAKKRPAAKKAGA